jgi:hypothetical protein
MAGYGPVAPLTADSSNGFALTPDLRNNIKQNLKMIVLTNPGERVMVPDFGVGIQSFLFEMFDDSVYASIDSRIREQVSLYMPYLKIERVQFSNANMEQHRLSMRLHYSIPRIALSDILQVEVL